jgi:hypothetical protein
MAARTSSAIANLLRATLQLKSWYSVANSAFIRLIERPAFRCEDWTLLTPSPSLLANSCQAPKLLIWATASARRAYQGQYVC